MHISTLNVSDMVTDRENITTAVKLEVMYGLSIRTFTFDLDPF